jgi:hypothetical protein
MENEVALIKEGVLASAFSDLLTGFEQDKAVEVYEALNNIKNGDVGALFDLPSDFTIGDAVLIGDKYYVTVSTDGGSYRFEFTSDKKAELIEWGLYEEPENVPLFNTTQPAGHFKFASLEEAIKQMGLRNTFCNGVYCQQHNPNKPAGDYSELVHYVWNEATHEMIELKNIYLISSNGDEAKGLEGYEEVLAYQQGYNFTDTKGIYEKDGKMYQFDDKSSKFVEVSNNSKVRGNGESSPVNSPEVGTTEGEFNLIKYIGGSDFSKYMSNLYNWCQQQFNSVSIKSAGLKGDKFEIVLADSYGKNGKITIESNGDVKTEGGGWIVPPPLPKIVK